MSRGRALLAAGALFLNSACEDAGLHPPCCQLSVSEVRITDNPLNALSFVASARVRSADSARAYFHDESGSQDTTPWQPLSSDDAHLVALGLQPETRYTVQIEVRGRSGAVKSEPVPHTTPSLPPVLDSMRLVTRGDAPPGFMLVVPVFRDTTLPGMVLAFDGAGTLRWYRLFAGERWAVEAKQQRNGNITVYLGHSYGYQPAQGRFAELAPDGREVRSISADGPHYTDPHELTLSAADDGSADLLAYSIERYDLSWIGGASDAPLAVHVLEHLDANGASRVVWSSDRHFTPRDWPAPNPELVDLDHPSAFARDAAGNYVISFQALDEVTSVDARTGAIRWRLGGRHNQFTIVGDPRHGFSGQHNIHVLSNGNLLLLDNALRSPEHGARAVEYAVDTAHMTATMVWAYAPTPPMQSPIMGSVQRLANGNTVIGLAIPGIISEVTPQRTLTWQARLFTGLEAPSEFYRAVRIASLYRYQEP